MEGAFVHSFIKGQYYTQCSKIQLFSRIIILCKSSRSNSRWLTFSMTTHSTAWVLNKHTTMIMGTRQTHRHTHTLSQVLEWSYAEKDVVHPLVPWHSGIGVFLLQSHFRNLLSVQMLSYLCFPFVQAFSFQAILWQHPT